ncbi:MAG: hypothetical protein H6706_23785 [Myxococcales bacterium]|nr:hypothetical protein [Myxococcales bacterium]
MSDGHLEAWAAFEDAASPARAPLLDAGWGAFAVVFGRPDVSPLIARLLLDLGPLPVWVRPAVVGTAQADPVDLLGVAVRHATQVALPAALAGTPLAPPTVEGPLDVAAARGLGGALGALAREALDAFGHGPQETAARLLAGAVGHYVRVLTGAPEAGREVMSQVAAATRALAQLDAGAPLALTRACLAGPWEALDAATVAAEEADASA